MDGSVRRELVEGVAELGDIGGGSDRDGTTDVIELGELNPVELLADLLYAWTLFDLLLEGTVEGDSTADLLELGETIKLQELGVVLDGHVTGDLGHLRDRDVGELDVVDESQAFANHGEIGGGESLELGVGIKLDGLVDVGQRRSGEALDVGQLNLGSRLEHGHVDNHVVAIAATVGADEERSGDVDKIRVERGKSLVVVDLEVLDSRDVETAEIEQTGVADLDVVGLGNTGGTESEAGQLLKADQLDVGQALQRIESERAE